MEKLTNYTFDEITVGQTAEYRKQITERDIVLFADVSGDVNPLHLDAEFAAGTDFGERIAHGMLTGALISAALALELPGPGTVYLGQSLRFRRPVKIGDEISVQLEVVEKREDKGFITLDCKAINQDGKAVVTGTAEVMAPREKLSLPKPVLPEVSLAG
ncbi:MAG: MaoC/PaaZ C-terminal domain-containing protein [Halieaceae bacterium]|nr:MaoC/PaaZ C-terminal domain-containing protein [Halieaceae bacterium]